MQNKAIIGVLIFLLSFGATAATNAQQILSPQTAGGQLLVLKNGEVLRGKITQKPGQYILETGQGSRIVLREAQVEVVCRSLEQAYWEKSARTKASDLEGQKQLFHWCIKQKLLDQAQNQLGLLMESQIKAAELVTLDRQLNVAILQAENREKQKANRAMAVAQKEAGAKLIANRAVTSDLQTRQPYSSAQNLLTPQIDSQVGRPQLDLGPEDLGLAEIDTRWITPLPEINLALTPNRQAKFEPKLDNQVIPVGFESSVDNASSANGWEPPNEMLSGKLIYDPEGKPVTSTESESDFAEPESSTLPKRDVATMSTVEIEQEIASIPKSFIGFYRKRVEKIYTNGCSAAKCHEPSSPVMPLVQRSRAAPVPKSMSVRNIYHISRYIDFEEPFSSPALLAAIEPHAGSSKPIFDAKSKQRDQLIRWFSMLGQQMPEDFGTSKGKPAEASQTGQADPAPLNQSSEFQNPKSELEPLLDRPLGGLEPLEAPEIGEIPDLESPSSTWTPTDPFDPAIFNRKHHGK